MLFLSCHRLSVSSHSTTNSSDYEREVTECFKPLDKMKERKREIMFFQLLFTRSRMNLKTQRVSTSPNGFSCFGPKVFSKRTAVA